MASQANVAAANALPTWALVLIVVGSVVTGLALTALIVPVARRIYLKRKRESIVEMSAATPLRLSADVGHVRQHVDEESGTMSEHTISAGGSGSGSVNRHTNSQLHRHGHKREETQDTIATKPLLGIERDISRSEEDDGNQVQADSLGYHNEKPHGLEESGELPPLKGMTISYPTKLRKVQSQNADSPSSSSSNRKSNVFSLPVARSTSGSVSGSAKGKERSRGIGNWLSSRVFHTTSFVGSSSPPIPGSDPRLPISVYGPNSLPPNSVQSVPPQTEPQAQARLSTTSRSANSQSAVEVNVWAETPVHTPTESVTHSPNHSSPPTPSPTHSPSLAPSSLRSTISVSALTNAFHTNHSRDGERPSTIASAGILNRNPSLSPSVASGGTNISKVSLQSGDTIFSYGSPISRSNDNSPHNSPRLGATILPFINAFSSAGSSSTAPLRTGSSHNASLKAIVQKTPPMPVIPESLRPKTTYEQSKSEPHSVGRRTAQVQSLHGLKDIQWQSFQPPSISVETGSSSTLTPTQIPTMLPTPPGTENANTKIPGVKKAHIRHASGQRQVEQKVVSPKASRTSVAASIGFADSVFGASTSANGPNAEARPNANGSAAAHVKPMKTDSAGTRTPPSEYYSLPSVDGDSASGAAEEIRPFSIAQSEASLRTIEASNGKARQPGTRDRDRNAVGSGKSSPPKSGKTQRMTGGEAAKHKPQQPMTGLVYEAFQPPPYAPTYPYTDPDDYGVRPLGARGPSAPLPSANVNTSQALPPPAFRPQTQRTGHHRPSARFPSTYSTLSNISDVSSSSFYSTTSAAAPQLPTPPSSPFQLDNLINASSTAASVFSHVDSGSTSSRNGRNSGKDRDSQSTLTVSPTPVHATTSNIYGRGSPR